MLSAASADWLALLTSGSDQYTKLGAAGAAPSMLLVASRWFGAALASAFKTARGDSESGGRCTPAV